MLAQRSPEHILDAKASIYTLILSENAFQARALFSRDAGTSTSESFPQVLRSTVWTRSFRLARLIRAYLTVEACIFECLFDVLIIGLVDISASPFRMLEALAPATSICSQPNRLSGEVQVLRVTL